ncbi:helix-turn-helix domain-containing protein [Streptomyces sp. CBMA152]|uniref:winged helix-turn-helix transcriptional regulator n=1 Tax=Streptomyces sp. CBMA152 TaxID=1896312 RepID=UPI0016604D4D|nr:helix-turn-helix domain-containing protein [Streptomyces sp. CBMA152]MBD0743417.1 transcriptional regulator [Streptomyces sp. CBMA152]
MPRQPRRRSYDQYCAAARALDAVGDRWTLLIVRELLAGPRRYTDLHADLPGVSTDVLASRLKDMEREGLATRRKLPPPGVATVYELTARGHELLPVLTALAAWGAPELAERRLTDAVRAHWFAIPLIRRLRGLPDAPAVLDVRLDEGEFHVRIGGDGPSAGLGPVYGEGAAPDADARLVMDADTCRALAEGTLMVEEGVKDGRIEVSGDGPVAVALRGE